MIVVQGEKFIDHSGMGKHDRSKLSDARSIRSTSILFQPTIRTLVIAGALESLAVKEHVEGELKGKHYVVYRLFTPKNCPIPFIYTII